MKEGDWVTLRYDREFVAKVLLDPREGLVFVLPTRWGKQQRTRDRIVGLAVVDLGVVDRRG